MTDQPARPDGRATDQLRPLTITTGLQSYAEGSADITMGETRVLCSASISDDVPRWLRESGSGWITGEYSMLPRATRERTDREAARGKQKGRTVEIQRLIGRSLRAAVDLDHLGGVSITLDCDVLQADGGTRTASISGAWVALAVGLRTAAEREIIRTLPELTQIAAVSVGIVDGVDTYTGETLEQIAARASEEAKRDASRGAYADGTAADAAAFAARADDVTSGGKCWSVDERREVMGDVRES